MSEIVRFISPENLVDNIPATASVDQGLLKTTIYLAQETKIQSLLGSKLYRALKAEVKGASISGKRKECLDDFIIPALYQWSYHKALFSTALRFTDKGLLQQTDTNATQASARDLNSVRGEIRNDAEFMNTLIVEFICANLSSIPEYNQRDEENGGVGSGKKNFSGIVYKGSRNKNNLT